MALTHSFTAAIDDQYGQYPEALIGVFDIGKKLKEIKSSTDLNLEYTRDFVILEFAYECSFYNSREMFAAGKKHRPITIEVEGIKTKLIEANLDDLEIKQIIASGLSGDDLDNAIVEADIRRRFV